MKMRVGVYIYIYTNHSMLYRNIPACCELPQHINPKKGAALN